MILKGRGFILRHIKKSDIKSLHENINDKSIEKGFMSIRVPYPQVKLKKQVESHIKEYKKKKPTEEVFVIEVDGKAAGIASISELSYSYEKHIAKIHYWIGKEYRGKGITTKAVKLLTDYAFKKHRLNRVYGVCRTFNKASQRVLEKAGYKHEGTLRKNKKKNGKFMDDMIWAKVR